MRALLHRRGDWLRTLLFATLALALVNQSVFGLGCLDCGDEVELHDGIVSTSSQVDVPADPSGEGCDSCCDALPPGQCGAQAASMTASLVQWHSGSQPSCAEGLTSNSDPPTVLAEQFRPPIR